jgi:hypothetical protein
MRRPENQDAHCLSPLIAHLFAAKLEPLKAPERSAYLVPWRSRRRIVTGGSRDRQPRLGYGLLQAATKFLAAAPGLARARSGAFPRRGGLHFGEGVVRRIKSMRAFLAL